MSNFLFKDEPEDTSNKQTQKQKVWRILVVDDDESVHQVTKLVLSDAHIEHRTLEIVSVYSCIQAQEILKDDDSFCMAFVDVVMETDHAGLDLVEWIRKDLKNQAIRLILRTGQAGNAPESKVIKEFDINDYKEKTDFTSGKMITTVYASIRAYRDIMTIQKSLDGFKKLIEVTHDLLKIDQFKLFGSAALNHLLTLMDVESSALYIARNQFDFNKQCSNMIIACTGKYVSESDNLDNSDIDNAVKAQIKHVFEDKQHYLSEECFVGYYKTANNSCSVLYIDFEDNPEHFKLNLVEMFANNVALILETLTKLHDMENSQKELMYVVGEAIEAREETKGSHVKRVALICELLAKKLTLDSQFVSAIRLAAPLHDIGKIAIPDNILRKNGKLDKEEWQVMQTHAQVGGDLLEQSKASISKLAAKIAHFHHENWDGSGYPEGLAGDDIPIEARIMAIADVFDSLGSKQCYKESWGEAEIKAHLLKERSKKFDPQLVDIFVENYSEFVSIRKKHPDNKKH
jgi:response regulator RpfG family c-di-GMP phosphodiesterase